MFTYKVVARNLHHGSYVVPAKVKLILQVSELPSPCLVSAGLKDVLDTSAEPLLTSLVRGYRSGRRIVTAKLLALSMIMRRSHVLEGSPLFQDIAI